MGFLLLSLSLCVCLRFYERGMRFSAMDVLDLTARTKALYPSMPLSVTIPHTLPMDQQVPQPHSTSLQSIDQH